MRILLIAASLAVLCAAPTLAADDVMAIFYGNTMVSAGGALTDVRTHYRADHTFDIVVSFAITSVTFKGTWAADGCRRHPRTRRATSRPAFWRMGRGPLGFTSRSAKSSK
jgi:hypothetical protein